MGQHIVSPINFSYLSPKPVGDFYQSRYLPRCEQLQTILAFLACDRILKELTETTSDGLKYRITLNSSLQTNILKTRDIS